MTEVLIRADSKWCRKAFLKETASCFIMDNKEPSTVSKPERSPRMH
jgi:hypothetical protein